MALRHSKAEGKFCEGRACMWTQVRLGMFVHSSRNKHNERENERGEASCKRTVVYSSISPSNDWIDETRQLELKNEGGTPANSTVLNPGDEGLTAHAQSRVSLDATTVHRSQYHTRHLWKLCRESPAPCERLELWNCRTTTTMRFLFSCQWLCRINIGQSLRSCLHQIVLSTST
eukprot:m.113488 g.113488  ORF g.113488 m.113488 type:complete len:174 (+) comp37458_c1_seq44:1005-1526(+)